MISGGPGPLGPVLGIPAWRIFDESALVEDPPPTRGPRPSRGDHPGPGGPSRGSGDRTGSRVDEVARFDHRGRPYLLEPTVTTRYLREQRIRPLTGVMLYVACGMGGWFLTPWVGLTCIILVILYHALRSEGVREGPLASIRR